MGCLHWGTTSLIPRTTVFFLHNEYSTARSKHHLPLLVGSHQERNRGKRPHHYFLYCYIILYILACKTIFSHEVFRVEKIFLCQTWNNEDRYKKTDKISQNIVSIPEYMIMTIGLDSSKSVTSTALDSLTYSIRSPQCLLDINKKIEKSNCNFRRNGNCPVVVSMHTTTSRSNITRQGTIFMPGTTAIPFRSWEGTIIYIFPNNSESRQVKKWKPILFDMSMQLQSEILANQNRWNHASMGRDQGRTHGETWM